MVHLGLLLVELNIKLWHCIHYTPDITFV